MDTSKLLWVTGLPYRPTTEPISRATLATSAASVPGHDQVLEDPRGCAPTPGTELNAAARPVQRPSVDIEFQDLSYTVRSGGNRDRKTILKNLSGKFRAGELTAILGPSGAGKSTLLNILVGYVSGGVTGEMRSNGQPRQLRHLHKMSTYIMQEDLLQPRLTVEEAMHFAADLKLGQELAAGQKAAAVDEILRTLGLSACRETRTERLSGGQRKRLSVALELVNNPPIIFLDEPTSGLDIVATKQCVSLLKVLAGQGRTIVCTIHQPSASTFAMFDQVYAVADGYCVYQGTSSQLVPHLAAVGFTCPTNYCPADYLLEIIQGEYKENIKLLSAEIQNGKLNKKGEMLHEGSLSRTAPEYERSPSFVANNCENVASVEFPTSFCTQLFILMRRMAKQMRRNKVTIWIQFLHHFLSACVLGGIYYGSGDHADNPFMNFKFSLSVLVFFMYTYIMTPVLLFPTEVQLLKREYFNRWYGLKSYYIATTLMNIPSMIIFGLIFLVVAYLLSHQPLDLERFCYLAVVGFMIGATSDAYGMVIGSLFNIVNGSVVAPASVSPLLALAAYGMGHGTAIEPIMNFLMSLCYLRYGLVGIATTLYGHDRPAMTCIRPENAYCHYQEPLLLLRDLGMEGVSTESQILALVIFYVVYRCIGYFALRLRLSKEFTGRLLDYTAKILRQK